MERVVEPISNLPNLNLNFASLVSCAAEDAPPLKSFLEAK